jgi:hypothetical protein
LQAAVAVRHALVAAPVKVAVELVDSLDSAVRLFSLVQDIH